MTFYYSQGKTGKVARVQDSQGNWTGYLGGLTREGVIDHHADGSQQVAFYAYQGKTPSGWLSTVKDNKGVLAANNSWQQRNAYGAKEAVYHPGSGSATTQASPLSLATNPPLIGFNGNYQDPVTQDVFMGARVYDPKLQRFLQVDSMDVPNRYAYAQDNPLEKWDPSGHMATWLKWTLEVGLPALAVLGGLFSIGAVVAPLISVIAAPLQVGVDVTTALAVGTEVTASSSVLVTSTVSVASSTAFTVGSSLALSGNALELTGHNLPLAHKLTLAGTILGAIGGVGQIASMATLNSMIAGKDSWFVFDPLPSRISTIGLDTP